MLAVLGVILPLLPTMPPLLLLAVWCFARSDPERARRLYHHPRFGPMFSNWRDEGAIPLSAKVAAVGALGLSYAAILWSTDSRPLHLILALIMGGVALYLITRPRPRRRSTGNELALRQIPAAAAMVQGARLQAWRHEA